MNRVVLSTFISFFFLFLFSSFIPLCTLEALPKKGDKPSEQGYQINFDNVPIKEFLKFISKIGNVNIIYNEEDLNFNVTIISEETTDLTNILSALVQVLRIHGLTLIEEEKNLLIHKNDAVRQIPTVVSKETPLAGNVIPPIITKVFKIQKGNPANIAALITPMLSSSAIVEVSMDTRQLIVTDVTSSIQTVENLLLSLDAPDTPYDVDTYTASRMDVQALSKLALQILTPISQNTTLQLIPQPNSQTIYIVSTPFLIDKTLQVLQEIDKQEGGPLGQKVLSNENILVYKLQYKMPKEVEENLRKIASEAEGQGYVSEGLNTAIKSMKYVQATNSLVFVGPPQDLKIIHSFLLNIDLPQGAETGGSSFYIYEPQGISTKEALSVIEEVGDHLEKTHYANPLLITTLKNAQVIPPINSILFTGSPQTLLELKNLLASIQTAYTADIRYSGPVEFFIYNIKSANEEQIRTSLNHLADYLDSNNFPDTELLHAIDSMRWIKSTNSLLFTGHAKALKELSQLLPTFDVPPEKSKTGLSQVSPSNEFILYSPKHIPAQHLKSLIDDMAKNLKSADLADPAFLKTLESVRIMPTSDQLLFTGDKASLTRLNPILVELDQSKYVEGPSEGPYFVHLKHADYDRVKIALESLASDLPKDNPIRKMVETMQFLPDTNVIVFKGPPEAMKRIAEVVTLTDIAETPSAKGQVVFVQVTNKSASEMVTLLHDTAEKLSKGAAASKGLIQTLKSAESMPGSNTIILSGSPENIQKAKELIQVNDISTGQIIKQGHEVVFINVEHKSPKEIVAILHQTARTLEGSPNKDIELIDALKSAQVAPNSNTIIVSGTAGAIAQVRSLIVSNDVKGAPSPGANEIFVYKLHYLTPAELQTALMGIAEHASVNGSSDTEALVQAIRTMRPIPDSNAVQFVAQGKTIEKLKDIIVILDNPENAKSPVKPGSTFLVYKVKHANPQELLAHLKQIGQDAKATDPSLNKTINSAKYASGSNSLIFTGPKIELDKIHRLLEELDLSSAPQVTAPLRQAEGYKIYKPQFVPGTELIQMVKNFEGHLVASGVTNEDLAETIDHLAFVARTNTIIVTGTDKGVQETMVLLQEFDNRESAPNLPQKPPTDIETIEDIGFLIYKLQHQSGTGIVHALSLLSKDLNNQKALKKNQNLIEAIQSVQWIEPTNSLIATGEPKVLTRLRELIESFDRPQKQVFIEILVIESSNDDSLDIGLRWGSQGALQNRFSWGSGSYATEDGSAGFPVNFNQITGERIPTGSDIPPIAGGFLGVIGDIVWHKGKSYAALGTLLNALKTDGTSTIILSQKIVAQDNQNAKIFSGDNVPFTGSLVTTSGLSQTTNANLEYRNIGVTLSITPIISDNGIITLDIDEEISEEPNQGVESANAVSTNTLNGIRTTKTSMQTRVHMPDQHFLILSGTMRNQVVRNVSGIPCLGGLPLIGAAFTEIQKTMETRNLIVFVKPHIITSPEVFMKITKNQEELFGSRDQSCPEDYERGLELIQSPDDANNDEEEKEK